MNQPSDTPRTDANSRYSDHSGMDVVSATFARTLERELNEAKHAAIGFEDRFNAAIADLTTSNAKRDAAEQKVLELREALLMQALAPYSETARQSRDAALSSSAPIAAKWVPVEWKQCAEQLAVVVKLAGFTTAGPTEALANFNKLKGQP